MLMQKNKMRGRNLGPQLGLFVQLNIRVPWKRPGRGTTNNFVMIQKKTNLSRGLSSLKFISCNPFSVTGLFLYPLKIWFSDVFRETSGIEWIIIQTTLYLDSHKRLDSMIFHTTLQDSQMVWKTPRGFEKVEAYQRVCCVRRQFSLLCY